MMEKPKIKECTKLNETFEVLNTKGKINIWNIISTICIILYVAIYNILLWIQFFK